MQALKASPDTKKRGIMTKIIEKMSYGFSPGFGLDKIPDNTKCTLVVMHGRFGIEIRLLKIDNKPVKALYGIGLPVSEYQLKYNFGDIIHE